MPDSVSSEPITESVAPAAETLNPLVLGTTLLDRYTIVEVISSEHGVNTYRVAEMRRCPNCGVENEGNLTHCGFCGLELPAPRTLVLTERAAASSAMLPTSFMLDGLTYAFTRDASQQLEAVKPAIQLRYHFLSDPGLVRGIKGDVNEDSVLAFHLTAQHSTAAPLLGLFIVADGVGGAAAGEVASQLAIQTVAHELLSKLLAPIPDYVSLTDGMIHEFIRAAISEANVQVLAYGDQYQVSLGATITLALVLDDHAYFANVGDSRSYMWRDQTLTQLTRDHSYVAQLVIKGEITAEEARVHPQRNLILKSLGDASGFEVDIFPSNESLELQRGDQFLLCSDGLWEMVNDAEIQNILAKATNAQQACAQLISFANAAGGVDNISVIVFGIE